MAGRFQPTVFGLTVIIVAGSIFGILALATTDGSIALEIPPPELRFIAGCFRDCLDPTQTGFGTLDCPDGFITKDGVCIEDTGATIVLTDPNDPNNTIEEKVLLGGGIMVIEDPVTGEETVVIAGTDILADPFPALECPEGQMFFDPDITDGIQGICWDITVIDSLGQTFETVKVTDTIACWLQVTTQVISDGGIVLATSKGSIFKLNPNPVLTLSLVDLQTQASIEKGGFKVFPKIKCSTSETGGLDPQGTFGFLSFPSFDIPLRIEPTELTVRVYSQNPQGNLVDTFNAPIVINRLDITDTNERT